MSPESQGGESVVMDGGEIASRVVKKTATNAMLIS